ncbi:MAG TPA: gliding motility-associated C-terminal domain-containing protein, partial [Chryseolinea sp.]|nr:gliding motility-associated C-terminal domain-containing protein [Chryseolinea sp.]
EKIGEVRRDFQMLVVDVCPQAEPPQILGKALADPTFTHDEQMNITFSSDVTDENRCIQVQVSDPDASKADDNYLEKVRIRAISLGFHKNLEDILPVEATATLVNGSTKIFQVCFDKCPYVNGPFKVGIVAYDDACSLPLSDTLMITVNITPPPNVPAQFTTPDVVETLNEGQIKRWPIAGLDPDGDQMIVGVILDNFRMADVGMTLVQKKLENGTYEAELQWDTRCDVYDFSHKTQFEVKVLLEDVDECNINQPDVMTFKLAVKLPGNADPIIDSDLTGDPAERVITGITRKVNESLVFHVTGRDTDNDYIVLGARGVGFNMADYNVVFPGAAGSGSVVSPFTWNIFCDAVNLDAKDKFTFEFIVVDNANKCRIYRADTLDVTVDLLPPDNEGPLLQIASLEQNVAMINNSMTVTLGQQITLGLSGTDSDISPQPDWLKLDLIDVEGSAEPDGYIFAPAEGQRSVSTTFTWKPECSLLAGGVPENNFVFTFNVTDDRCFNQKGDTLAVNITIRDTERNDEDFMPPNIITPNGDNLNDFFAMLKEDPSTHELVNILPSDNCAGHFEGISIFNRWGKQVYESFDKDFRWYAENEVSGVYFYTLKYSDKDYKGMITLAFDESQSAR